MRPLDLGSWWHLARRFLEVAFARSLSEFERFMADSLLRPGDESAVFWMQPTADQRHAFNAARRVQRFAPDRRDLMRAALLHDVGKRHSGLGLVGRSLASALAKLGGSPSGRMAAYLDHGALGAAELERLGCEPVVVAFARHHHEGRVPEVPEADWRLLELADEPGKVRTKRSEAIR